MPVKSLEPLTDEQLLLNSVKQGNKIAFGRLYDRYALALFGIINGLTNQDTSLSEQILHDCFCAIWQNIKKYDPSRQRLFTWMISIARITATDTLFKRSPEIQGAVNSVDNLNGKSKAAFINPKSALELCFNGYSLQEAAKKLDICTEDLRIKLRQELNPHRQTSI